MFSLIRAFVTEKAISQEVTMKPTQCTLCGKIMFTASMVDLHPNECPNALTAEEFARFTHIMGSNDTEDLQAVEGIAELEFDEVEDQEEEEAEEDEEGDEEEEVDDPQPSFESSEGGNKYDWVEDLISRVFERPILWDCRLPYEQRGYDDTSASWLEVDELLGVPLNTSQRKFKNIRDRFVKLLAASKKLKKSGGAALPKKKQWKYMKQCGFLTPCVDYRPTSSGLRRKLISTNVPKARPNSTPRTELSRSSDVSDIQQGSTVTSKRRKVQSDATREAAGSSSEDSLRRYCEKQLEECSKNPDKISTFCMFLESELREMDAPTC